MGHTVVSGKLPCASTRPKKDTCAMALACPHVDLVLACSLCVYCRGVGGMYLVLTVACGRPADGPCKHGVFAINQEARHNPCVCLVLILSWALGSTMYQQLEC